MNASLSETQRINQVTDCTTGMPVTKLDVSCEKAVLRDGQRTDCIPDGAHINANRWE
jgi:hypothetical protein